MISCSLCNVNIVGHGRSEGERVHVEDVDTYVQDVIHHVELMKNKYPHLPCILMGHSMVNLQIVHVSCMCVCITLSILARKKRALRPIVFKLSAIPYHYPFLTYCIWVMY